MEEALRVLDAAPGLPLVAVVGCPPRSCYEDHDMIFNVLEILRARRMFRPVHGGKAPFDLYTTQVCERMGLLDCMIGPEDTRARFDPYVVPLDILDGACLLVAFPPPGRRVEEANPQIVGFAKELGIPVLGVDREGKTTWTT